MEEKIPFSFRNQVFQAQNQNNSSYKTTTVSTMNNEDFVVSLNKEMELILHNIEPKKMNFPDNFHGSPNFNQHIINTNENKINSDNKNKNNYGENQIQNIEPNSKQMNFPDNFHGSPNFNQNIIRANENKMNSDNKNKINHGENQVFLENDSFGQEREFQNSEKKLLPVEIKELSKNFKDSIDREKFAEVLNKNYELKLKNKDLEMKLLSLITELSECQKALEENLKIQISSTISEETKTLAINHNSLKKDLECLEDENEKLSEDLAQKIKKEKELIAEIHLKETEINKIHNDYSEEMNKVNKLLELNQELTNSQKLYEEKLIEKDQIIDDLKLSSEKNSRTIDKNIRDHTEIQYKYEKNLKTFSKLEENYEKLRGENSEYRKKHLEIDVLRDRFEYEMKDKITEIECLKRELTAILNDKRNLLEQNEESLKKIDKLENITNKNFEEFEDLTQDLKEIIKELIEKCNNEDILSEDFKSLGFSNRVNPLETGKEMIIMTFKEIQNLIEKILNYGGFMEKCSHEFEEKVHNIEEKYNQKIQILHQERDYLYELFSKTCQMIKNEKFSENVSKLLGLKNEVLTQEMEVKMRENEYFGFENHLKRLLAEKNLKPENIIQMRGDLEKKKAQLIYIKKNFLKSKEEINFLEEEFDSFKENDPKRTSYFNNSSIYEKKTFIQNPSIPQSRQHSITPNERPERLSLKDKLEKSRKIFNSPSKM